MNNLIEWSLNKIKKAAQQLPNVRVGHSNVGELWQTTKETPQNFFNTVTAKNLKPTTPIRTMAKTAGNFNLNNIKLGQSIGKSGSDFVNALDPRRTPVLFSKQGTEQMIKAGASAAYGYGKVKAMFSPYAQAANLAVSYPKQTPFNDVGRRMLAGGLQSYTATPSIASNVPDKNVDIFGMKFDPAKSIGGMVGFVQNPTNKQLFKLTEAIIPTKMGKMPKYAGPFAAKVLSWIAKTGVRGGIEQVLMSINDMPDNLTEKDKQAWILNNLGSGAISEVGGQVLMQSGSKILKELGNTKVANDVYDYLQELGRKANIPVNRWEDGKIISEPLWKVKAKELFKKRGGKLESEIKLPDDVVQAPLDDISISKSTSVEKILQDIDKPKEGLQGKVLNETELNVLKEYLNKTGGDELRGTVYKPYGGGRDVVFGTIKDRQWKGQTEYLVMNDSGAGKGSFRLHSTPITEADIISRPSKAQAPLDDVKPKLVQPKIKVENGKIKAKMEPIKSDIELIPPDSLQSQPVQKRSLLKAMYDRTLNESRNVLNKMGKAGQNMAKRIDEMYTVAQRDAGGAVADFKKVTNKLDNEGNEQLIKSLRGEEGLSKNSSAVKNVRKILNKVYDDAKAVGLDIGYRKDYAPQIVDLEKLAANKEAAAQHLVKTKQIPKIEKAIQFIDDVLRGVDIRESYSRFGKPLPKKMGNLEFQRVLNWLPDVLRTDNRLIPDYIEQAYARINQVKQFGKNGEIGTDLLNNIQKQGYDVKQAQNIYDQNLGLIKYDRTILKTSQVIRNVQAAMKLSTGAITNATQSVNTATVGGARRTAGQIFRYANPSERKVMEEYALRTGATLHGEMEKIMEQWKGGKTPLEKLIAPFFNQGGSLHP